MLMTIAKRTMEKVALQQKMSKKKAKSKKKKKEQHKTADSNSTPSGSDSSSSTTNSSEDLGFESRSKVQKAADHHPGGLFRSFLQTIRPFVASASDIQDHGIEKPVEDTPDAVMKFISHVMVPKRSLPPGAEAELRTLGESMDALVYGNDQCLDVLRTC